MTKLTGRAIEAPTVRYIHPNALCPCGKKPFRKAKYCCGTGILKTTVPGMIRRKK